MSEFIRKFQSPIIRAEQWNGRDGHLGVKLSESPVTIWVGEYRLKSDDTCPDCGYMVKEHGTCDEPDAKNCIVCPGDYITENGPIRPKLYFEDTYKEIK